ncbi:MAG: arsenate reductase ArsC, partial [Nitrospirales bacterium]
MKRRVLFLCTGNSCRSQMAEGVLRHLAGDRIEVASAGTHPVGLNSGAVEAMKEIGIEIARHRSKSIQEFQGQPFDYVITVCDRTKESCPVFPGATTVLSWSIDDPARTEDSAEDRRRVFRRVRDEIAERIRQFLQETEQKP